MRGVESAWQKRVLMNTGGRYLLYHRRAARENSVAYFDDDPHVGLRVVLQIFRLGGKDF